VAGWQRFLQFPKEARIELWKLVVDALAQTSADQSEQRLHALCAIHDLSPDDVVEAGLSAQFLLGHAVAAGLSAERFGEDLAALSGASDRNHEDIVSRFDSIRSELESLELYRNLTIHGKVLKDLEWRIDRIVSSSRGFRAGADVVFLTLVYDEAGDPGRITLQLGRAELAKLREFLATFAEAEPAGRVGES